MGTIVISDGISTRQIPTSAFPQTIRIEVGAGDALNLVVPEGTTVDRKDTVD